MSPVGKQTEREGQWASWVKTLVSLLLDSEKEQQEVLQQQICFHSPSYFTVLELKFFYKNNSMQPTFIFADVT